MKMRLLCIGKSKNKIYDQISDEYVKRLKHYTKFEIHHLKDTGKTHGKSPQEITKQEARSLLDKINVEDFVVLLDERGKMMSSLELAEWIQHKQNISISNMVFIIAGAYGAHADLKERADYKLSLSALTLTHDMVRIFITEQVYRAHTILRGEKYHNE